MGRISIVTVDTLSAKMAGPAIRVWEIATLLSDQHDVQILTFGQCDRMGEGFDVHRIVVEELETRLAASDVVIIQGYFLRTFPWLGEREWKLVVDLYDPFHFESLEVERARPMQEREAALSNAVEELRLQALAGDFFLCASEKQRDLWIGHLGAHGRVNPKTYESQPNLRKLIDVAPFGLSTEPPRHDRPALKGVVPGIGKDDPVIIWGGGIYNWFDPVTAIQAVNLARTSIPNVRLFFLGAKHPNPDVPEMAMAVQARQTADELGLTGTHVFFNEDWIEYEDRSNYLLESNLGISTHFAGVETDFSFRTRMLDYLWAGLPIVCTEGDSFATLVEEQRLGVVVPEKDPEALAAGIVELLGSTEHHAEISSRVTAAARAFEWPIALRALTTYCDRPWRAADKGKSGGVELPAQKPPLSALIRKGVSSVRTHGLIGTMDRIRRYLRR